MKCLHCGKHKFLLGRGYCENCYQELLSINIKLQQENQDLKNELQILKHVIYDNQKYEPKHLKEK